MNHVLTFSRREGFIYFVAAMTSILLSLWLACRESVVNPDAVCYLLSAEAIGVSGIQGAMKLCGQAAWPFYSALIYGFAQLSQLSYITSAYLLDGLFSCLSVIASLLIVKELGATRRIMWLAALVILCSHEFISTREYIVRDHGFWAFYLVSLFALLRYARLSNWMNAITWSTSLLLATLFRIEGAFFLLFVPFVAWFIRGFSWKQRALHFCLLNLVTVCLGAIIAMWLVTHPAQSLDKLGRVAEVTTQLQHGVMMIAERFQAMKAALAQHVLTADSSRDAGIVLVLMMLSWYARLIRLENA
jgi:hypothetical protein